jgi:hypothetical protein
LANLKVQLHIGWVFQLYNLVECEGPVEFVNKPDLTQIDGKKLRQQAWFDSNWRKEVAPTSLIWFKLMGRICVRLQEHDLNGLVIQGQPVSGASDTAILSIQENFDKQDTKNTDKVPA